MAKINKVADTRRVKVLRIEDLPSNATLDQKSQMLQENRRQVFMHNVEVLQRTREMSQAKFCSTVLDNLVAPSRMTWFKSPGHYVSPFVMGVVAAATGIRAETLCGTLLDGGDVSIEGAVASGGTTKEFEKYIGTYSLTYFDTGTAPGENMAYTSQCLRYGLLTVYGRVNDLNLTTFHVLGLFNCAETDRATIDGMLKDVDLKRGGDLIRQRYENLVAAPRMGNVQDCRKCLYEGEIRLNQRMAEIDMRQVYGADEVHIMLHNRAADSSKGKLYCGGLATMMSMSRGKEHMPCVQALLISRKSVERHSKEALASALYMDTPKIALDGVVKDIVSYMRWLYSGEDGKETPGISDEDKQYCLETFISKKLTDVLKRNHLSYYKISRDTDSAIYKRFVSER